MKPRALPRKQNGFALIVLLSVALLWLSVALMRWVDPVSFAVRREQQTTTALARAKAALIGYAVTYGDTHPGKVHGYLPCPDLAGRNPEGSAETNCGSKNISVLGRLPWKTLDLPPLQDGSGACLWYAVSGAYKYNPKTDLMNPDTLGQLQVLGTDGGTLLHAQDDSVVAVILAPGPVQVGQQRTPDNAVCGGNNTAAAYLESDPVSGIDNASYLVEKFQQGSRFGAINDQIAYITSRELWAAIQRRRDFLVTLHGLTQQLARCLADYARHNSDPANHNLPWPAPLSIADTGDSNGYNDGSKLLSGRIPYIVNSSNTLTGNKMSGDILMANNGLDCTRYSTSFNSPAEKIYPWWDNWKDHLFYALAQDFQPGAGARAVCENCLSVNGHGPYAAAVLFSGHALSGQSRGNNTSAGRAQIGNYLEQRNATNHPNSSGSADYQTGEATPEFNDILYCIDTQLEVSTCP